MPKTYDAIIVGSGATGSWAAMELTNAGLIDALDYRGNSFNAAFPGCDHSDHHTV